MKTLLILERKDLAKIRKARDEVWTAYRSLEDGGVHKDLAEMKMLLNVKRLMDELLVEAEHDQG